MIFTKDVCPICGKQPITEPIVNLGLICDSPDHNYRVSIGDYKFANIIYKKLFLTSRNGHDEESQCFYINGDAIMINDECLFISNDIIATLKTEPNIIDYINNLKIIS